MKTLHVLAALLAVSVLANIALAAVVLPARQDIISELVDKTNTLGMENMQLQKQLDERNLVLQNFASSSVFTGQLPSGPGPAARLRRNLFRGMPPSRPLRFPSRSCRIRPTGLSPGGLSRTDR